MWNRLNRRNPFSRDNQPRIFYAKEGSRGCGVSSLEKLVEKMRETMVCPMPIVPCFNANELRTHMLGEGGGEQTNGLSNEWLNE